MPSKKDKPEEIIGKLREVEIMLAQGASTAEACRRIAVSEQTSARRRRCIDHLRRALLVSERRICRVLGQHRSTQRKVPRGADDEQALAEDIIALAKQYGRYGYRR